MNIRVNCVNRIPCVAFAIILIVTVHAYADVCVYKPPKVRRISGFIVDQQGVPIPGVTVALLEQGAALSTVVTNDIGRFDFDVAKPGKYEMNVTAAGFRHARYELTLSRPTKMWNHALTIEMEAGGIHRGGDIRVTEQPPPRR